MAIPVKLTEDQFQTFVEPYLSWARRGYACKIPRYKLFNYLLHVLYTGCQWPALQASIDHDETGAPELSFQAGLLPLSQVESGWQFAARL